MMTPYPYDVIGAWLDKHDIEVSSEAYEELAGIIDPPKDKCRHCEVAESQGVVHIHPTEGIANHPTVTWNGVRAIAEKENTTPTDAVALIRKP